MQAVGSWFADNWFGVFGIVAGGLIALVIAVWQRQPKTLDYEIVNSVAILTPHAEMVRGKLQVLYDDVPLEDPHIVTIKVVNTGKRAVLRADFVRPIQIQYEKLGPFDGNVVEESTPGLFQPESIFGETGDSTRPSMTPELLNPGDYFAVQLLSNSDPGEIEVSCRFADQSRGMRRIKYDPFTAEVFRTLAYDALPLGPTGRTALRMINSRNRGR